MKLSLPWLSQLSVRPARWVVSGPYVRITKAVHLNGDANARVAGNLNIAFDDVYAEDLIEAVPSLELSVGSACHGDRVEPSHVLSALGQPERLYSSIRIGIGRYTTKDDIQKTAAILSQAVAELRMLTACG